MTKKLLTITMTNRPPIRIDSANWSVIARSVWYEGSFECQANRRSYLKVLEHGDGRRIVYGEYMSLWQGERDRSAGVLLAAPAGDAETVAAIRSVAAVLEACDDDDDDPRTRYPSCLADACIADLPPEDLV